MRCLRALSFLAAAVLLSARESRAAKRQPTTIALTTTNDLAHRGQQIGKSIDVLALPLFDPVAVERQLEVTAVTAIVNLLINGLRPDAWLPWHLRVPRILWELLIATTAKVAAGNTKLWQFYGADGVGGGSSSITVYLLLLTLMTSCTGIIDIFFWAPIASASIKFESCTGGGWFSKVPQQCTPDPVKGYGRLLVTIQCVVSGFIYLKTAVLAWDTHSRIQRREKMLLQRLAARYG